MLYELILNSGSGALTITGNALQLTNTSSTDKRVINNSSGLLTINNNIALNGYNHLYAQPVNGNILFNGVVSGGTPTGLYISGGNMVTFANAGNSFINTLGVLDNGSIVANVTSVNNANGAFGNASSSIVLPNNAGQNTTVGVYGGVGGVTIGRRINATVPVGSSGVRIVGGLNTNGTVTFSNYIDGPTNQAVVLYAAPGGLVNFTVGVIGNSSRTNTGIIVAGGGSVQIGPGDASGNTYSGTTTVRAGNLLLNGNDFGSTGNYVLGSSSASRAVELGDSGTQSTDTIRLLAQGAYTINHNISVNSYGSLSVIGANSSYACTFAGDISLAKNVALQSQANQATTFSGQISDGNAGIGVSIVNSGTVILTGSNSYSGGTAVNAGTLLVNNTSSSGTGSGAVTVAANATLGGTGAIGGNVTFAGGALALFTKGTPLTIAGSLTLSANIVHLNLPSSPDPGTYPLATYTPSGSSGAFAATPVIDSGSLSTNVFATITTGGGQVSLVVNLVVSNTSTVLIRSAGGVATFSTSTLALGSHSLQAVYPGDAFRVGSTSSTLSQTVNSFTGITRVASMPNIPSPFLMRDWKAETTNYDSFVFNYGLSGQYLPLIKPDNANENFILPWFALPSYVGVTNNYTQPEAINAIAAILDASNVGMDKSNQGGTNWVRMMSQYFNSSLNVLFNNAGSSSSTTMDFWYQLLPHILFAGLVDRYPATAATSISYSKKSGSATMNDMFFAAASNWYGACKGMGANSTTAPNFNCTGYSFVTNGPYSNGVFTEPEGAAGVAWLEYMAWRQFGQTNANFLQAADWSLQFMQNSSANVLYETLLPYGVLAAARMNAELGRSYNVSKFMNWCFDPTSPARSGWGVISGTWNGSTVHGLVGSTTDGGGYAFGMNTFEWAGALAPVARYDQRYAHDLGKWLLNLANNARLFYSTYVPANHQSCPNWLNGTNDIISYEGLRATWNGTNLYATGDYVRNHAGAGTDYATYGGSHVGLLGALVGRTSDDKILQLDLVATDYFKDTIYPTYLYYNPYPTNATFTVNYGSGTNDILNIVSERFLRTNASGSVPLTLPPDTAAVVVVIPSNAALGIQGTRMYANGRIVNYHYSGLDTDGDGLPDWWETRYYGNATNASPLALARNGRSNLDCYQLGISPLDPQADLKLQINLQAGSGYPQVTWPTIGGKTYDVCSGGSLAGGLQSVYTVTETNAAVGMTGTHTYVDPLSVSFFGATNRYYRIQLHP